MRLLHSHGTFLDTKEAKGPEAVNVKGQRGVFKESVLWADFFYKSKCPYVCVCVCSLFEVPFKRLFAPTSRSRMSKNFRDSKSLGKSSAKKWSQI